MSSLHLDAEALYADLQRGVRKLLQPDTVFGTYISVRPSAALARNVPLL